MPALLLNVQPQPQIVITEPASAPLSLLDTASATALNGNALRGSSLVTTRITSNGRATDNGNLILNGNGRRTNEQFVGRAGQQ